jgi:hypothetical protein
MAIQHVYPRRHSRGTDGVSAVGEAVLLSIYATESEEVTAGRTTEQFLTFQGGSR